MRFAAKIALLGTGALLVASASAFAGGANVPGAGARSTSVRSTNPPGITVPMDQVRLIAFSQPVSTVYVGNPMIADVAIIDPKHAFLLGKTFGETNVIALGLNGAQVSNQHIVVFGRRVGAVTLNRGAAAYDYTCTQLQCETQPVPGNPTPYFVETHEGIDKHEELGIKGANASTGKN